MREIKALRQGKKCRSCGRIIENPLTDPIYGKKYWTPDAWGLIEYCDEACFLSGCFYYDRFGNPAVRRGKIILPATDNGTDCPVYQMVPGDDAGEGLLPVYNPEGQVLFTAVREDRWVKARRRLEDLIRKDQRKLAASLAACLIDL